MTTELTDEQRDYLAGFDGDAVALLGAASDPASPLHNLFDWDAGADADANTALAEELLASAKAPTGEDGEAGTTAGDGDDDAAAHVEGNDEGSGNAA